MLKRVRMLYDLTVVDSISKALFVSLKEEANKITKAQIDVFYLAENKKGVKDICIRVQGSSFSEVKNCFHNFVDTTNIMLEDFKKIYTKDLVGKLKKQTPFPFNGTIIDEIEIVDEKIVVFDKKGDSVKIPIDVFLSIFTAKQPD